MKVIKKSFGIIMTLSVLCLVLLIAGVFFLSKGNEKTFTNSGYIISYKSGNTEVNNFEEGVEYKYNVNGELVFKNNEKEKVVAGLDNFIHYTNGDTSFLQNGVILNLENVGDTTVPYYNITDKSLIEFNEDKYTIKNVSGDLTLNNWIGRISEKKYIVSAKNVTAKLAGTTEMFLSSAVGNFFEITYEENGVVIVSDGVNTRSTTAENSYIYIGEDIVISLNDKYIYYNNEPKLSLTQMTINGDENIEIIPPEEEKEEDNTEEDNQEDNNGTNAGGNSGGAGGNGGGAGGNGATGNGDGSDGEGNEENSDGTTTPGDGNGGAGGNASGGNGSNEDENKPEDGEIPITTLTKNPIFRIVNADIGANSIDLDIEIIDEYKVIQSSLDVSVINMKTAEEVYQTQITDIKNVIDITTPDGILSPETNYIVSISGNYTNEDISYEKQYFQRVFKTESLDIKLEKSFTTQNSVSVLARVGNASSVKGYNIAIYSKDSKDPIEERPILIEGDSSEEEITFEVGLQANTEYRVILNNIKYNGITYTDVEEDGTNNQKVGDYTIPLDVKTLKRPPFIGEVSATVNDDMTKVKFDIGQVTDEDKSVVQYAYYVYEYNIADNEVGTKPIIEPIIKKDASPFEIDIDGTTLKTGQSYRYMVIAEYNDNEKIVEIMSGLSNPFVAGAVPSVSFAIDKDKTTFNSVTGTIKIADDNCTVPIEGRSCYDQATDPTTNEPLKIFVRYHDASSTTFSYEHIEANFNPQTMEYQLNLSQLKAKTETSGNYKIEVFGSIDFKDGKGIQSCTASKYEAGECIQIGESMFATTNEIVPITVEWGEEKISNHDQVFSLGGNKLKSTADSLVEAQSLSTITMKVYASNTENIADGKEIATIKRTGDIKNEFFDNNFTISATNTFGLDIKALKQKTDGLLTKYYIFELIEAKDIGEVNNIGIKNNTYAFEIDKDLRADDILTEPTIAAELKQVNNVDTGFDITIGFDGPNLGILYPEADYQLTLGVCGKTTDKCIDFKNFNINETVKIGASEYKISYQGEGNGELKLKPGTDYYNTDELCDDKGVVKLYRGNEYSFRFYITVDENKDGEVDYYYPGRIGREYVGTPNIKTTKKVPEFYINPVSSTPNSITYNFNITDSDVSLYKEKDKENYSIYYTVGDEEVEVPLELNKNIEFTIENLSNNTPYSIYYNTALTKNGDPQADVKVGHKVNYTFDGFYNLDDYHLDYILENNEASNKIIIKLLDTPQTRAILPRISVFELELKEDGTNNSKKDLITKFNDCAEGSGCLKYFDYHYSNVKDWDRSKMISVYLYAYYDSGLIAKLGEKSEFGYLFQQNSTEFGQGKYFEMRPNTASNTTDYTRYYFSETDEPKSVYDYHKVEKGEFNKDQYTGEFKMEDKILGNKFDTTKWFIIKSFPKSSEGYKYGTYTFNFKKVDKKEIQISEGVNNKFGFSVITPDISITHNSIINGADISINTSSIISSEMPKNFVADKEDGKYYFYVELYNEDGTQLLETKKVEIKPQATTDFTFENLDVNTKYIYKIFGYFKKNGESYIQLNDTAICDTGTCGVKDYEFKTLAGSDLYGHLITSHSAETTEENYDDRSLNLDLTLNAENVVNVLKNYDLIINLIENDEVIDTQTILNPDLANNQKLNFDITNYETIFGTDYYKIQLLAKTTTPQGEEQVEIYNEFINLKELATPTIAVIKSAKTEGENSNPVYSLEYEIGISDPDKTISSGYYTIKLLDRDGRDISSKVKLDEDGNEVIGEDGNPILEPITIPVTNLETIRFVSSKVSDEDTGIVIPQIVADRPYQLVIEFNTHMNNQSLIDKNESINKANKYSYTTYSSGVYGVSLGDIEFADINKNGVTLAFFRSANIANITKMDYTIIDPSKSEDDENRLVSSAAFTIGEGMDKMFSAITGSDKDVYHTFEIKDENITLQKNAQYLLTFNFYVTDANGEYQVISTSNNSKTFTVK